MEHDAGFGCQGDRSISSTSSADTEAMSLHFHLLFGKFIRNHVNRGSVSTPKCLREERRHSPGPGTGLKVQLPGEDGPSFSKKKAKTLGTIPVGICRYHTVQRNTEGGAPSSEERKKAIDSLQPPKMRQPTVLAKTPSPPSETVIIHTKAEHVPDTARLP